MFSSYIVGNYPKFKIQKIKYVIKGFKDYYC